MEKDLQRIDIKVFVDREPGSSLDPILTAFDRWRQETDAPYDWVDLADYAHMTHGPAVMMAGKRDHIALDTNEPGLGILVQTRKGLEGDVKARFLEAFRRFFELANRLTGEPEWPDGLKVRANDWLISINDRLQFPNQNGSEGEVKPGLTAALDEVFGAGKYAMERVTDSNQRFGYQVKVDGSPELSTLAS